jgi:hypothetical protein
MIALSHQRVNFSSVDQSKSIKRDIKQSELKKEEFFFFSLFFVLPFLYNHRYLFLFYFPFFYYYFIFYPPLVPERKTFDNKKK